MNDNDYQDEAPGFPEKAFDIYTVWSVLKWNINKWLYLGLDYRFNSKQANDATWSSEEYDRHQGRLFIGGTY